MFEYGEEVIRRDHLNMLFAQFICNRVNGANQRMGHQFRNTVLHVRESNLHRIIIVLFENISQFHFFFRTTVIHLPNFSFMA